MIPTVCLVNRCTQPLPFGLDKLVEAGQELIGYLGPAWKVQAHLMDTILPPEEIASGIWCLYLVDRSDQPGAVAYHAFDAQSPWGMAGIQTALDNGVDPVLAVLHELVELLVNPFTDEVVEEAGGMWLTQEPVDPVEQSSFKAKNGLPLPNFVYPAWYGQSNPSGVQPFKLDHLGLVSTPGTLLPGGYVSEWSPETGWRERWADDTAQAAVERKLACVYSRMARLRAT